VKINLHHIFADLEELLQTGSQMNIVRSGTLALASLMAFGATSANALVVFSNLTLNQTATVSYIGSVNGSPTTQIGATTIFKLNSITNNEKDWNFSYSVTNTSTVDSRLRSFGFDVTGLGTNQTKPIAITGRTADGMYGKPESGDTYPEGFEKVNTCFRAAGGNNCTGGPDGLTKGDSASGLFTIKFKDAPLTLTLDRFVTRFQSISPSLNGGGTSGIGKQEKLAILNPNGTTPAPEPAQWAMFIGGFGVVGATLRRRRRNQLAHAKASLPAARSSP
jgi:hypothetical protein